MVEEGDLRNVAVVLPSQPEYPARIGKGERRERESSTDSETRGGSHVPTLTSLPPSPNQPAVWLGFTPGETRNVFHDTDPEGYI